MSISDEYREIYVKEIVDKSRGIIFKYSPVSNRHEFQPLSHAVSPQAVEQLCGLMRKNLLFYCYGEDEVVKHYKKKTFADLDTAAQYAYKMRLPKRPVNADGIPSEVLLDLLIQIYTPNAYKLAVRALMRQKDNNEIKGYDLTYFSLIDDNIGLWLGQAKLGDKSYCKDDISKDLLDKFSREYLSEQVFFVCDKQTGTTDECEHLTDIINRVNIATLKQEPISRQKTLLECFQQNRISIYIPCLLAYGQASVYKTAAEIFQKIEDENKEMQTYFLKHSYSFSGFDPKIIFYIFPIEDIDRLRDAESGFYCGLR
ncbi:protein of unknown function [Sporobacter termitidis DSM 10068]|uniref:Anti-bacteriophage protein A/HamA C-terminal domain-containing protein n=1 Tax=Sporobacter termitidis DSM 10068 TaxID=1123282 RepID=A0A1M5U3Q8_9FIRM|nr:Hachiman antiphage defense system protein HamA [Sporobacter termitidis]SHH57323.1 protein of unknown function [Sporobacter termitidis DSM 10068]